MGQKRHKGGRPLKKAFQWCATNTAKLIEGNTTKTHNACMTFICVASNLHFYKKMTSNIEEKKGQQEL